MFKNLRRELLIALRVTLVIALHWEASSTRW